MSERPEVETPDLGNYQGGYLEDEEGAAVFQAVQALAEEGELLVRFVVVAEWAHPEGTHYVTANPTMKPWDAKGLLREAIEIVDDNWYDSDEAE